MTDPVTSPNPPSQGRRLPDAFWPDVLPADTLGDIRDGDYWKLHDAPEGDVTWVVYWGGAGRIPHHHVEEHDDGTISVLPQSYSANSVLIQGTREFHGKIRRGVWEPYP